ncbi:transposase zinc-binding domain-containing protein [Sorangium sp. So ce1128]
MEKVRGPIAACRTAVLGGHVDVCTSCGHEQPSYNSCPSLRPGRARCGRRRRAA